MIYANNAGTSWPKPPGVAEAVGEALASGPHGSEAIFDAARVTVCGYLGIADPERFLFTPSCTSALSVALEDLPWQPGDRVLTSSLEHHALGRPVQKLVERREVRHTAVPYRPGQPLDLDFLRDELRRGGVRLVAITGASNVTGEVLPVAAAASLAHEHDALLLLDAAQTVGVIPVDVTELQVDMLVFAGHKGPLGPQGIGGLWAAPHVGFDSPQAACSLEPGPSRATPCAPFPGYCDVGSVNIAAAAGLDAGLRWLTNHALGADRDRARRMARLLATALSERHGCTVHGGVDAERTATVSFGIEGLPPQRAQARFKQHGIVVRGGEHCAPWAIRAIGANNGTVRISFGPYNETEDVERILMALDAVKEALSID